MISARVFFLHTFFENRKIISQRISCQRQDPARFPLLISKEVNIAFRSRFSRTRGLAAASRPTSCRHPIFIEKLCTWDWVVHVDSRCLQIVVHVGVKVVQEKGRKILYLHILPFALICSILFNLVLNIYLFE